MLDKTDDISVAADNWLAQFEEALAKSDGGLLKTLFHPDSYWRDVLALSWNIQTVNGADAILREIAHYAPTAGPRGCAIDPDRAAPRKVMRAGTHAIEAIFKFETKVGRGSGIIRLIPDAADGNKFKAWTLLTELGELKGFEEQIGVARPRGNAYSRDFRGPNWLDLRKAAAGYAEHDPTVLVIGGGQSGLSIAARLKQLNVDTLIVDREKRIGDNWRKRYHALTLHNQVQVNHLPYMLFPPNWPTYIPKDKLANWFEAYVESMELNFWTETEFEDGSYDENEQRWTVTLRRADGSKRTMHPRHVVLATGVSGIPSRPEIAGLEEFRGTVMHSSQYDDGENWKGKRAIVIGTGNSGHDIAQDLHSSGAKVTLFQRSSTLVVSIEPSAQLVYAPYNEGTLEDNDLIATSMPLKVARKSHALTTEKSRELDKELLEGLARAGFKLDFGEDNTGWQFKYLTRGGGYYFNVGCSDLIVNGDIRLKQFADVEGFGADGARMKSGETIAANLVVLA
ncbi:MAG: flavin-containing monooxygenase, partial [Bradyrhizobium sp.]